MGKLRRDRLIFGRINPYYNKLHTRIASQVNPCIASYAQPFFAK